MEYCLSEVQIVSKVFFPDLAQLGRALDRLRANLDVIIADPDPSVTVEGYGGTTWVDQTIIHCCTCDLIFDFALTE